MNSKILLKKLNTLYEIYEKTIDKKEKTIITFQIMDLLEELREKFWRESGMLD